MKGKAGLGGEEEKGLILEYKNKRRGEGSKVLRIGLEERDDGER